MSGVPAPGGGRLHVAVRGEGPPLLLLRPLGGSIVSWGPFADALAAWARVVMFDARGTGGLSPAPPAPTTRTMAADARAVLDALGIARAHVYGVSLGGMVASWLAVDAPERVDRLLLASTPVRGLVLRPRALRHAVGLATCLLHRDPAAAEACLAERILTPSFRARHPDAVAAIRRRAVIAPASRGSLLRFVRAALGHDVRARVAEIRAQTLVVGGGCDRLVPPRVHERLAARLPQARLAILPDVGHDVSAEAPAAVAALVRAHVDG